jgi:hypothetical protein
MSGMTRSPLILAAVAGAPALGACCGSDGGGGSASAASKQNKAFLGALKCAGRMRERSVDVGDPQNGRAQFIGGPGGRHRLAEDHGRGQGLPPLPGRGREGRAGAQPMSVTARMPTVRRRGGRAVLAAVVVGAIAAAAWLLLTPSDGAKGLLYSATAEG